ncbi:MAG: insulinase family protein, partial [Bacteroidota bacterium]
VAQKLIHKDNLVITVSAPERKGVIVPTEKEILAKYDEISKKDIPAYENVVLDKPLFDKKPVAGKIVDEKSIKDLGITELKLSNGIKVVLKQTDFQNDEVTFTSFAYGGHSLSTDKDFISSVSAASIINQSGAGNYDATQFEKYLAGKVVSVRASVDELSERVSGSASTKDIELMFQLINLQFTAPRKDKEAFQSYISRLKSQIKESKNAPRAVFSDTINSIVTNYHFRGMPMTEERMNEIDLEKAYKFYIDRFAHAGDFTFFFVGNFQMDKIKPLIETYLAGIPSTGPKETWKDNNIKPPKGKIEKTVLKGIEKQSTVRLIFSGNFDWSVQDRYQLTSLMEAFNIRLREVLREDTSGVYGAGAWASPRQFPRKEYRVDITFGCDPKRVDELIDVVLSIMDELKTKALADTYIEKIKEIQKKAREVNLKENNFWLNSLNNYYFNGEDPKLILDYPNLVNKLTAQDLLKTAQKYFVKDNFIRVVLKPENN